MFVFLIKNKGILIKTQSVPLAKTRSEAWEIASMGLADYPPHYEVVLEEENN
jgi:hypothetical protein